MTPKESAKASADLLISHARQLVLELDVPRTAADMAMVQVHHIERCLKAVKAYVVKPRHKV